ncbi:hypothetical protein [Kordiimonas pumila]|uniref:Uncharacterized protein n=1 Tax=Kordiimonas pumila TaxID=2161677 RepID=A0ABV7D620_9PROT|nr:hypothetical protein [Kordiimonas pumila]
MNIRLKIPTGLFDKIRSDLKRPHFFAHERVGFLTAGVAQTSEANINLFAREYFPVADEDYEVSHSVGAQIGSNAIRKGLQSAYKDKSALIHIHTHGGMGIPNFSSVDLKSGKNFVPSFFNLLPQVPHGLGVLSNNAIRLLAWVNKELPPQVVREVVEVGSVLKKYEVA